MLLVIMFKLSLGLSSLTESSVVVYTTNGDLIY